MFIEKLKEEDIKGFVKRFDVGAQEIKKDENSIYVLGFTGSMGPQPEFHFEDFKAHMLNHFTYFDKQVNDDWRVFLYLTFGEEYREAIKNHYEKDKNDVLKTFDKAKKGSKNEL